MFRRLSIVVVAALLAAGLPGPPPAAAHRPDHRPVVFVHGSAGSGHQFETQAKRLASNGYPADIIEAHEYDSTFTRNTVEQIFAALDARVARLRAATGADRVDLLAHSLGTALMQAYLRSTPERAATVAHYVNLDGATATGLPGGVPTLAIWGEGSTARAIVGATNVYLSDQAHTQSVTSPESFVEIYRFLTGRPPVTTRILPQLPGRVLLSGRAVLFPTNVGVQSGRLEIYRVNRITGARLGGRPEAVFPLTGDGSWGPFRALGHTHYEFAIVRPDAATHHFYYQPFIRSDRLIRLLTSLPGTGLGALMEVSDRHSNLVISRNKEWWGDQGEGGDRLAVNGVDILNAANSPRTKRVIGIFAYDRHVDQVTDLTAPIPVFFAQTFITGMDVYIPVAASRVTLVVRPRAAPGPDILVIPAWPATTDRSTVQFNDF